MKKILILWLPFLILSSVTLVSLLFYYFSNTERSLVIFIQVPLAVLSAAVFPFLSSKNRRLPLSCLSAALFIFLASILGSLFGFYHRFIYWDFFMHSLFGLVGAIVLWEFFTPSPPLLILSVFGASSLWELFEFSSDILLSGDAQRVQFSLKNGINPISDTMVDIASSGIGILLFFLFKNLKLKKSY